MNKHTWLNIAEIIDALRVIPRGVLIFYGTFYLWYIYHTTEWYFAYLSYMVENEVFSVEAIAASTAFVTATITALGGMFTWFAGNVYMKTGRVWGKLQREELNALLERRYVSE